MPKAGIRLMRKGSKKPVQRRFWKSQQTQGKKQIRGGLKQLHTALTKSSLATMGKRARKANVRIAGGRTRLRFATIQLRKLGKSE